MPILTDSPLPHRTLLRDDVYRSICDAILRGQLAPREQLRNQEPVVWLQVSRTPAKEALQRLAPAGLVIAQPGRMTPGRMTRVAPESPEVMLHAREIAAQLHTLAMSLAFPALMPDDVTEMERANDRLRSALDTSDTDSAIAADDDLHEVAPLRS